MGIDGLGGVCDGIFVLEERGGFDLGDEKDLGILICWGELVRNFEIFGCIGDWDGLLMSFGIVLKVWVLFLLFWDFGGRNIILFVFFWRIVCGLLGYGLVLFCCRGWE